MDADMGVRAIRAGKLVDEAAGALLDLEPLLSPVDRRDLRELVVLLGWWSGRLDVTAEPVSMVSRQDRARDDGA